MTNILVLGGTGFTGKLIVRYLLEYSDTKITVAARHLDRVQAYAREMNLSYTGERVAAVYADAADEQSLRTAFRDQTLVVIAAPTTIYAESVIKIALEMGVDYLDVQLGAEKFTVLNSFARKIEASNRCFITEAGFHPGLPSALVRFAAAHLDTIETALTAGYLNMGKDLPYTDSVDELIESFKGYQGKVLKKGKWTKPNSFEIRKIDFGGDIGPKNCYSMFFEELSPLPEVLPSLKDLGFYISEIHWVTDWLIMSLTWLWLMIIPQAVRPIGKFLWWGMRTFHRPPYRVELQIQATGLRDGNPAKIFASVSHPDGYVITAIPVVATLLQYLDGSANKPGLWMMGHLVEPTRLMRDMENMGLQCLTRIE